MFRKKSFRTNYSSIFSSKVQNLTVFSIMYMIRIRFFGPGELIQFFFWPHSTTHAANDVRPPDIARFGSFLTDNVSAVCWSKLGSSPLRYFFSYSRWNFWFIFFCVSAFFISTKFLGELWATSNGIVEYPDFRAVSWLTNEYRKRV